MDEPTVTPGYTTTAFWVTVFTAVAAIATQFFHKDLGPQVPALAVLASGIVSALYALSRGQVHAARVDAAANIKIAQLHADSDRARIEAEYPSLPEQPARTTKTK